MSTRAAAKRIFTTWARPNVAYDRWWADLEPMLSESGAADYQYTDPDQIPALRVTGAPVMVQGRLPGGLVDENTALVTMPTSIGTFGVYLTRSGDGEAWRMLRMRFPAGIS